MAFYCVPCLEPRVPGYYLAKIRHNGHDDMYYWDNVIKTVTLHKSNGSWWVMPDYDIQSALERLYGSADSPVIISGVRVYEHGVDSTQPNDDARFLQCMWSDYGSDGISVRATVNQRGYISRRSSMDAQQ